MFDFGLFSGCGLFFRLVWFMFDIRYIGFCIYGDRGNVIEGYCVVVVVVVVYDFDGYNSVFSFSIVCWVGDLYGFECV